MSLRWGRHPNQYTARNVVVFSTGERVKYDPGSSSSSSMSSSSRMSLKTHCTPKKTALFFFFHLPSMKTPHTGYHEQAQGDKTVKSITSSFWLRTIFKNEN